MAPIDGFGYVVVAFAVTWVALLGYVLHLNARARAAIESIESLGHDASFDQARGGVA